LHSRNIAYLHKQSGSNIIKTSHYNNFAGIKIGSYYASVSVHIGARYAHTLPSGKPKFADNCRTRIDLQDSIAVGCNQSSVGKEP
jgi:hypothetical protein